MKFPQISFKFSILIAEDLMIKFIPVLYAAEYVPQKNLRKIGILLFSNSLLSILLHACYKTFQKIQQIFLQCLFIRGTPSDNHWGETLETTTYSSRAEVLRDELNQLFGSQERNIDQATRSLKVLAHPARLKILCALRTGEQTVQDLEYYTGLKQTTLSQHLSLLRSRDIVTSRREANFSFYRIANDRILELFELIKDIYCQTWKESKIFLPSPWDQSINFLQFLLFDRRNDLSKDCLFPTFVNCALLKLMIGPLAPRMIEFGNSDLQVCLKQVLKNNKSFSLDERINKIFKS